MFGFSLHPNVYSVGPHSSLIRMLENTWVKGHKPGDGIFYIISGFGNYNGGVRFYDTFSDHIDKGGSVVSIFSGSTAQRITSNQVVKQLLQIGADVTIVNRKRLLHAKIYGTETKENKHLIVSSGNFTGPGMSQNVEASLFLDNDLVNRLGFSWGDVIKSIRTQRWDFYSPTLENEGSPAWKLLYDEYETELKLDETEESTLLVILGHSDTARILAEPGSVESKGTQYFWLSRDCFDFFPPLTIRNVRGDKATYSCLIKLNYVDLEITDNECRVTFEAENNSDFRLGTGVLRGTKIANPGDIAALSRTGEKEYELRIIKQSTPRLFNVLETYAINFVGHRGKKYGFLSNQEFEKVSGITLIANHKK
jgi:hypothetical protein